MSVLDYEEDFKDLLTELQQYEFDFENLVFSGGGIKTVANLGGIQVLHELGILQKCKHFAATSGGSVLAALLAMDFDFEDIKIVNQLPYGPLIQDNQMGILSLVPNVITKYGWNPADKFLQMLKDKFEEHTGNPNITFEQANKRYNKSLCLVGANLSSGTEEYFHHKTTPDFPIALAIRISNSLPVLMQPVFIEKHDMTQIYVDGGITANYPLYCFDGWYLSMKPEDSFFHRLGSDEPHFEGFNSKTLGFLMYTASESEFQRSELYNRQRGQKLKRPNTQLAKKKQGYCDQVLADNVQKRKLVNAGLTFLNTLKDLDAGLSNGFSINTFQKAFDKLKETKDGYLLFGDNFQIEDAFQYLDRDKDGKISFDELMYYMSEQGIHFRTLAEKGTPRSVGGFGDFFGVTLNTVLTMSQLVNVKDSDVHRTVGVYHDYIDTSDMSLEERDKHFLIRQGVVATMMYFKEMLDNYKNNKPPKEMDGCIKPKAGMLGQLSSGITTVLGNIVRGNAGGFKWGSLYNANTPEVDKEDY